MIYESNAVPLDRYEYDVFIPAHGVGMVTVLEGLNNRGAQGWEVFKVHESLVTAKLYFWMRRKVVRMEPLA